MVDKQRSLLASQNAKLTDSAARLRENAEETEREQGMLTVSEQKLEELLRRRRIMEGMVLRSTRKLMKGRRQRDELLGGLKRGKTDMGKATLRAQAMSIQPSGAAIDADIVGRALKRRRGAASDFF